MRMQSKGSIDRLVVVRMMTDTPPPTSVYVHESVEAVVPTAPFVEAVARSPLPTELVGDGRSYTRTDAVVTYEPRDAFLEAGWVHCARAGYDAFDTDAYEAAGVPLTNSSGIHGATVGEVAIGSMLALARLLHIYRDHEHTREWYAPPYERPFTLEGERLCMVGLGTIGQAIAERADALGMDVVGVRRSEEAVPGVATIYPPASLHEAIADAYLINVARGPIVDETALAAAVIDGEIAGAALDVFEQEPLPADSPLWDLEEVIVMPHKGSATNQYHEDIAGVVRENIDRATAGRPLHNRVA
jgi:D-2-hydroxyacid dehydrogenase (NADP+)